MAHKPHTLIKQGSTDLARFLRRLAASQASRDELDQVVAKIRAAQIELFGPRPRAKKGEGAIWKMLALLQDRVGQQVHGETLAALGGIGEWARRLRELRVEHGYDIQHTGGRYYVLHSKEPDTGKAEQWQLANKIRNSGGSAKSRVDAFLRANVGKVIRRDQIDYVAKNVKEGTRRLRELRDQEGWPILTRIDEPSMGIGEYLLLSLDPADFRDPAQREYPEETRKEVFERDDYRCQKCGRSREDALKEGETRFFLEVDHIVPVADVGALTDEEKADPSNLQTLCHRDHVKKTAKFQAERRERRRTARG